MKAFLSILVHILQLLAILVHITTSTEPNSDSKPEVDETLIESKQETDAGSENKVESIVTDPVTNIPEQIDINRPTSETTHNPMEIDNDSGLVAAETTSTDANVQSSRTHSSVEDKGDVTDSIKSANENVDNSQSAIGPEEEVTRPAIGQAEDNRVSDKEPAPLVIGSVSDLKVMAKDELPSEDALTAGIQALIAKTQESSAMLEQVMKQKKVC